MDAGVGKRRTPEGLSFEDEVGVFDDEVFNGLKVTQFDAFEEDIRPLKLVWLFVGPERYEDIFSFDAVDVE